DEDQTYTAAGQVVHNCVKKCPFDAIRIIGLPEALKEDLVHQYGKNAFRLFRLPVPKKGEVIGLLGPNVIGKTTCVGLLSGEVAQRYGGGSQRMAIAATMLKEADIYFFDAPSSYLDIYQRLQVAKVIQSLSKEKYVVVVEHDLAVLDFLADTVFLMYGEEGAY